MCSKHGDYRCIKIGLSRKKNHLLEKQTSSSDESKLIMLLFMFAKKLPKNPNGESKIQVRKIDTFKKHNDTHTLLFSQNSDVVFFGVSKPNFNNIATYSRQLNVACYLIFWFSFVIWHMTNEYSYH